MTKPLSPGDQVRFRANGVQGVVVTNHGSAGNTETDNDVITWRHIYGSRVDDSSKLDRHPDPAAADYEWSTRDSSGLGWIAPDEATARTRLAEHPRWTLHRRQRWVSYGEFEDVL